MTVGHNPLWSDEPTGRDLLSFVAVAQTVADAVLDERLDPIALGALPPRPGRYPWERVGPLSVPRTRTTNGAAGPDDHGWAESTS